MALGLAVALAMALKARKVAAVKRMVVVAVVCCALTDPSSSEKWVNTNYDSSLLQTLIDVDRRGRSEEDVLSETYCALQRPPTDIDCGEEVIIEGLVRSRQVF